MSWEVGRVAASPLMEGIIVEIPFSLASASIASGLELVLTSMPLNASEAEVQLLDYLLPAKECGT